MAKTRTDQRSQRARGGAGHRPKRGDFKEKSSVEYARRREGARPATKLAIIFHGTDLEEAIRIASDVVGEADWLCIGPALIKSQGMRGVRALSIGFPEREIFADLKSSIGAKEESMMAFEAGADLISVAATASNKACREAIGVAKTFGGKVAYDLYGAVDPVAASRKALELGFDYLYLSTETPFPKGYETYRRIAAAADLPLIVDGEIEFREFARVSHLLPAAIVVGKQITEAADCRGAAARFGGLIHRRRAA